MRTLFIAAMLGAPCLLGAQTEILEVQSGFTDFGVSIARVGDIDGDGFADVVVGSGNDPMQPANSGAIQAISALDGSVLWTTVGQAEDKLGAVLETVADYTGDGAVELATTRSSLGPMGAKVVLLDGLTGAVISEVSTLVEVVSLSLVGDIDGDGVPEFIGGRPFDPPVQVPVYSVQLNPFQLIEIAAVGKSQQAFGTAVLGVGDVDGDGTGDFVVGHQSSALTLWSGARGVEIGTIGPSGCRGPLAMVGDQDGDGLRDILCSSVTSGYGSQQGQAHIFSVSSGTELWTRTRLGDAGFGSIVDGGVDVDMDGHVDWLVAGESQISVYSGSDGSLMFDITTGDVSGPVSSFPVTAGFFGDTNQNGFPGVGVTYELASGGSPGVLAVFSAVAGVTLAGLDDPAPNTGLASVYPDAAPGGEVTIRLRGFSPLSSSATVFIEPGLACLNTPTLFQTIPAFSPATFYLGAGFSPAFQDVPLTNGEVDITVSIPNTPTLYDPDGFSIQAIALDPLQPPLGGPGGSGFAFSNAACVEWQLGSTVTAQVLLAPLSQQ